MTVGARRRGVLLVRYLMLNEGVKEFVVEGFVPGLAGEHLAEVRAAPCAVSLALETDKGPPVVHHERPHASLCMSAYA